MIRKVNEYFEQGGLTINMENSGDLVIANINRISEHNEGSELLQELGEEVIFN